MRYVLEKNRNHVLHVSAPHAQTRDRPQFTNLEPHVFIYPLFSRRPRSYSEGINQQQSMTISQDWTNLPALLDRITNPQNPVSAELAEAMHDIVGVQITAIPSPNGKLAGSYVNATEYIYLERMGAGVANAAALLSCVPGNRGKVFLIEEPETDLHPAALRRLLRVIEGASQENQFFISTHSHVVLRHLGGLEGSRVFHVTRSGDQLPECQVVAVDAADAESRLKLLDDLGYELSDFDLYDGWLILEEASAERIIRDYLIKWFAPTLIGRLRTLSTRGVNRVEATFDDYQRLFTYAHLDSRYGGRAWVVVDGDEQGRSVIETLRGRFASWNQSYFRTWHNANFEEYFPPRFESRVRQAIEAAGSLKRGLKQHLFEDLLAWIGEDEELAKREFGTSAAEVIQVLREIEAQLRPD
ncbi:MAG: AAA family ATPase [Dehalococcoidia bacterium]